MEKRGDRDFVNLLKSTRVYRVLPSLMIIIFAIALTDKINEEIFILTISLILVYSSAGIYNAIQDNDYLLPKYSKKFIFGLIFIALLISFTNQIIFFTVITWIMLGFVYNKYSRFLLFGDTTILAITHFTLPLFSSLMLLGIDKVDALKPAGIVFVIFWFLLPIKNLKGIDEDIGRNYKTLATKFQNGKTITIVLFAISFILMTSCYLLFNSNKICFIALSLIFVLGFFMIKSVVVF